MTDPDCRHAIRGIDEGPGQDPEQVQVGLCLHHTMNPGNADVAFSALAYVCIRDANSLIHANRADIDAQHVTVRMLNHRKLVLSSHTVPVWIWRTDPRKSRR